MPSTDLPVWQVREALLAACRDSRRFALAAPTGSGKSTQVPSILLDGGVAGDGQIVILQPRRMAARLLAKRVAYERGGQVGGEVGYSVRLENRTSADTRIVYLTEGLLLRRLQSDPLLRGVSVILFDEFHERHLDGDLSLALARQVQERRPELILGVMSATLDIDRVVSYLGPCAKVEAMGRAYPVDVQYVKPGDTAEAVPMWEAVAKAFKRSGPSLPAGDVLVFMPGSYEIRRTIEVLGQLSQTRGYEILPLHGELPPEQQDAAVTPGPQPKIIVSTNVAETSLTIEGVRVVIDAGYARQAAHDPRRGLDTLLTEKISIASAEQRTGRAGRVAAGLAIRLWTEAEHASRPLQTAPEIQRLDLAGAVLSLKRAGISDLQAFPWFEKPEALRLERAVALLHDLGALDHDERLTRVGQQMAAFPAAPRLARMLIAASEHRCLPSIALLAALSEGRRIVMPLGQRRDEDARERELLLPDDPPSDHIMALRAWQAAYQQRFDLGYCQRLGIHAGAAREAGRMAGQYLRLAHSQSLNTEEDCATADAIIPAILAGFSDQVGKRLNETNLRCALPHGRRGEVGRHSLVKDAPLLVSTEIEEREAKGEVTTLLQLNSPVEEAWLQEFFPDDFTEQTQTAFRPGSKRVVTVRQRMFRDLVLESKELNEPDPEEAAAIIAREVQAGNLQLKHWNEKVENYIARVNVLAKAMPDYGFTPIDDEARQLILEQLCLGLKSVRDLADVQVMPAVQEWLPVAVRWEVDPLAPERFTLPNGFNARLRYEADGTVVLSAKIQQLYDCPQAKLKIADGRISLVLELLAPNMRPVQKTADLDAFWGSSYLQIKKDLRGRYPKHEWR
ncbi:MAG: ATP-dependent helicase HrpB [Verrucomicrobiota bacterium JB022]|nr:ATP-dependent helicase HrpB [Verrucomicrobiota bacterium JB022]